KCSENPFLARIRAGPNKRSSPGSRVERNHPSLLSVDLFGALEPRLGYGHGAVTNRSEETRFIALVAGRPGLIHLDQERVAVAVKGHIPDHLEVPASFTFDPELLAGTTPEDSLPCFHGLFQRFPVHPAHHEDPPGRVFLDNGWNQSVRIKFKIIE